MTHRTNRSAFSSAARSVPGSGDKFRGGSHGAERGSSPHGYAKTAAGHGRRGRLGSIEAGLGRTNDRPSVAWRSGSAADHHQLSAEGSHDPAADPATASGNPV